MNEFFKIDKRITDASDNALKLCKKQFEYIDEITEYNQQKVQKAFIDNRISESHFCTSTGYGYGDIGREALDKVWAQVLGAESALVRHNFTCGTHTLSTALFGVLRPGDTMLCVSGTPYDTIHNVIGISGEGMGSLKDFGIKYQEVALKNERLDYEAIEHAVNENTTMVYIQRSRGYELRPSLSVDEIGKVCKIAKKRNPNVIVMVDNCYGEFVERIEPSQVGADMIVGSLIKNPGGGLAPCGGYIAGKKECVEQAAYRLSSPGLGKEVGATLGVNQSFYQGLFLSPVVVAGALKGAIFAANVYEKAGFVVRPDGSEPRYDIIQAVELGSADGLLAFCKGIQAAAPVDSFVTPEPWPMPGYDSDVIMAAGAFVQGSSIELSADGPLKEPYSVFFQGGLTWYHAKLGIMMSVQKMFEKDLIKL